MSVRLLAEVVTSASFQQQDAPGELITDFECHVRIPTKQQAVCQSLSEVLCEMFLGYSSGLLPEHSSARKQRQPLCSPVILAILEAHRQQSGATAISVLSGTSESMLTTFEELAFTTSDSYCDSQSFMFVKT